MDEVICRLTIKNVVWSWQGRWLTKRWTDRGDRRNADEKRSEKEATKAQKEWRGLWIRGEDTREKETNKRHSNASGEQDLLSWDLVETWNSLPKKAETWTDYSMSSRIFTRKYKSFLVKKNIHQALRRMTICTKKLLYFVVLFRSGLQISIGKTEKKEWRSALRFWKCYVLYLIGFRTFQLHRLILAKLFRTGLVVTLYRIGFWSKSLQTNLCVFIL